MTWQAPTPERYLCRAPLEVDAVRVGELFLFINPAFDRSWSFTLSLRGEQVSRWDVKPTVSGHNNPRRGCPEGFGRKVRKPEHEHVWVEGLDCRCARALEDVDTSNPQGRREASRSCGPIGQRHRCASHRRIEPCVRFSRTRLSDTLHR
jgi:hypothetical protein